MQCHPVPVTPSLDPEETKSIPARGGSLGTTPPLDDPGINWRHSGWYQTRDRISLAMESYGVPAARLDRFRHCGSNAWVYANTADPSDLRVMANCCHDRWCQPCQRAKATAIRTNLATIAHGKRLRLVTLTLRSAPTTLRDQLQRLLTSWRKLKASKFWRSRTTGGAMVLELTWNKTRHTWHPHLHVLHEGKYLPHSELKKLWSTITGGSFIVDLRPVKDVRGGLKYLAKYIAKPVPHSLTLDQRLLVACIEALHGSRTINTFGRWRGTKLTTLDDDTAWLPIDSLASLTERAHHGDPEALRLLTLLTEHSSWDLTAANKSPPNSKTPPGEQPST